MRIVYDVPIAKKIHDAITKARENDPKCRHQIRYIILTQEEAVELYDFNLYRLQKGAEYLQDWEKCIKINNGKFRGVTLKVEGLK